MKLLPYFTLALLILMLYMLSGTLTRSEGVAFALPERGLGEGAATELVALAIPHGQDTFVFFDDARYVMRDDSQTAKLGEQLAERAYKTRNKSLLVLADRRVHAGDLLKLGAIARTSGLEDVVFAARRQERSE